MAKFFKKREKSIGLPPGSLIFIGNQKTEKIRIRLIDFNKTDAIEETLEDINEAQACRDTQNVSWINIDGLHDIDLIRQIGDIFNLHPLLLEDILNTDQRPKVDEYENCVFAIVKMLRYDENQKIIIAEQFSFVLLETCLLTFQESYGDVFDPVRVRIKNPKSRIRNIGIDYLAYALLDTLVDNYIHVVERMGEQIESIEDEILNYTNPDILEKINSFKRELNYLRKNIRPAKETIYTLANLESELISEEIDPFFKDLQDLITQATDAIEMYREMLSDQLNIYNSNLSNRMNETMRVLTVFAAIFIPLTFIAGIYGMNFSNIPELQFKYGYFILWGIMLAVGGGMLIYFRKKNWL